MANVGYAKGSGGRLFLTSGEITSTIKSSYSIGPEGSIRGISFDEANSFYCGTESDYVVYLSGQFTTTAKGSWSSTSVDSDPHGISSDDDDNTAWCGVEAQKLYVNSGRVTSTVNTSQYVGGVDTIPSGVSISAGDAAWCGYTDDKIYLTSGEYSSTIKDSQDISSHSNWIQGIGWNGTNTLMSGWFESKVWMLSGRFTTTVKDSEGFSLPTGIETDDEASRLALPSSSVVPYYYTCILSG